MDNVLATALEVSREYEKPPQDAPPSTPSSAPIDIVFHSFSMGGYLYGQSLRCIAANTDKYGCIPSRIKAQIFDSPPDRGSIAVGISKSVGMGRLVEMMVEAVAELYLKVCGHDQDSLWT